MTTFYVLYNPAGRVFVRAGRGHCVTISLNAAKHFTSEWCANVFRQKMSDADAFIVKKIQRY